MAYSFGDVVLVPLLRFVRQGDHVKFVATYLKDRGGKVVNHFVNYLRVNQISLPAMLLESRRLTPKGSA